MRALKLIVGFLVAITLLVLGIGLFLPRDYRVERSIEIDAAPEVVVEEVNRLRDWDDWSPWLASDPTIENTYSGPEAGVGARVEWTSENAGEGTQVITASEKPTRIETHLDFGDMGQADSDWSFEPQGNATLVTWGMSGNAPGALGGYFARMMDGWVGPYYEDGLERLKSVVEEGKKDDVAPAPDQAVPPSEPESSTD